MTHYPFGIDTGQLFAVILETRRQLAGHQVAGEPASSGREHPGRLQRLANGREYARLYDNGMSRRQIAIKFGVSPSTVQKRIDLYRKHKSR